MELSKRHKLLLGVVGVGAAALAVDRFLLNDAAPATAGAQTAQAPAAATPAQTPAQAATPDGSADRLQRLADAIQAPTPENEDFVAMAFTAPMNWLPDNGRAEKSKGPQGPATKEQELAERFRLTSVYTVGPGYAVISGEKIAVGQTDEKLGLKLLSIEPPAHKKPAVAVIDYRGQQVRLTTEYGRAEQGTTKK